MQKKPRVNTITDILPGFYPSVYTTVVVGFLSVLTGQMTNRGTLENSIHMQFFSWGNCHYHIKTRRDWQ